MMSCHIVTRIFTRVNEYCHDAPEGINFWDIQRQVELLLKGIAFIEHDHLDEQQLGTKILDYIQRKKSFVKNFLKFLNN